MALLAGGYPFPSGETEGLDPGSVLGGAAHGLVQLLDGQGDPAWNAGRLITNGGIQGVSLC